MYHEIFRDAPPLLSTEISSQLTCSLPRRAGQIESNYDETVDSFDEMNLKPELLRGEKIPLWLGLLKAMLT
jgi:translation initiation factor 4A